MTNQTSALRDLIHRHRYEWDTMQGTRCNCGQDFDTTRDWSTHLAEVISEPIEWHRDIYPPELYELWEKAWAHAAARDGWSHVRCCGQARGTCGRKVGGEFNDTELAAVPASLELTEEWGNTWAGQGPAINRNRADAEAALTYARQQFPNADYPHQVVRRLVGPWKPLENGTSHG